MAAKKRKKHPAKKKHAKKTAGGLKTVLGRLSSARKGFKSLNAPALGKVGSTLRDDVARVERLEYEADSRSSVGPRRSSHINEYEAQEKYMREAAQRANSKKR